MTKRFAGKVALVTGGTSGIGRATALAFAREGARIVVTGRREEQGAETVRLIEEAGGEALFVRSDVSVEADVKAAVDAAVERFGRLDFAFNNAGTEGQMAPLVEQSHESVSRVLGVNVVGLLDSMRYEIPAMLESGGGVIVNNASIAGTIGMAGVVPYVASKHAVIGATKAAALELAQLGIRVNAVAPAAIQTEMYGRFVGDDPEMVEGMRAMHPIGRVGRVEEIAEPVLFLCSDAASFVTGETLMIDGGFTAQ